MNATIFQLLWSRPAVIKMLTFKKVYLCITVHTHMDLFDFILWIYLNSPAIYLVTPNCFLLGQQFTLSNSYWCFEKMNSHTPHSIVPDLLKVNTEGPWKAVTISS